MKSEHHSSHPTFSQSGEAAPIPSGAQAGLDDTEETYVPSTDMEDSSLAPTGLDNPFWT